MKILLTGSSGYLGSVLFKILLENHSVVGYDNNLYYGGGGNDIRDLSKLKEMAEGCDLIIALAGVIGDEACAFDKEYTKTTNIDATGNLLFFENKRIIFASSCSVYGFQEGLVNEQSKLNPISFYAESKIKSEEILSQHPNCVILRFPTMFGLSPRMRYDLVINKFILDSQINNKICVHGGDQWRPFCSVKDIAVGISRLVENEEIKGMYNFGGFNTTIKEVAEEITNLSGCSVEVDSLAVDNRSYRVDFSKIEDRLGVILNQSIEDIFNEILPELMDFKDSDIYYNNRSIKRIRK